MQADAELAVQGHELAPRFGVEEAAAVRGRVADGDALGAVLAGVAGAVGGAAERPLAPPQRLIDHDEAASERRTETD